MDEPISTEDRWERIRGLLLEQYKDSPNLNGILEQMAAEDQKIEVACQEMLAILDIDAMSGANLDLIGAILCCPRGGLADSAYKVLLKASQGVFDSGTPERIRTLVKAYSGATRVQYYPKYPAGFKLVLDGIPQISPELDAFIAAKSPSGVGGGLAGAIACEDVASDLLLSESGNWIMVE